MSRILFATFGSLGDLHPYIAVGRSLAARGHEAVIATSGYHRASVEAAGLAFAPVRPDLPAPGDFEAALQRLFHPRKGPEYLVRELLMPQVRAAYDDLRRASGGADLLVSHPLAMTLPLVAQVHGLPWVGTVLSPLSMGSAIDPPLYAGAPWLRGVRALGPRAYGAVFSAVRRLMWRWEAPLRSLRADLGLPPLRGMALFEGQFSPLANLALFDPLLAGPQADWPANLVVCGAPLYDGQAPDERTLTELEAFLQAGAPPIVFALGSSAVGIAGGFWEHAAEAARRLNRRAVLLTGKAAPAGLPAGVRAFSYAPYSLVFPRGAAVVHQAGIGTLSQALRSGRPQLIVPVAFDQPDNARRAERLGVGRVLPFHRVTADRLVAHLHALLENPEYAGNAGRAARRLAGVDGAGRAAGELANLKARTGVREPLALSNVEASTMNARRPT